MSEPVSPCCGYEYTDNADGPSYCCGAEISEDGLCIECFEHTNPEEGYVCDNCLDIFEEPVSTHEYEEKQYEDYQENKMDQDRLDRN